MTSLLVEFADYFRNTFIRLKSQIISFRSGNDRFFRSTLPPNKERSCQITTKEVASVAVYGIVPYSGECTWPAQRECSLCNTREAGRGKIYKSSQKQKCLSLHYLPSTGLYLLGVSFITKPKVKFSGAR
jgi:hypothetical protein